MTNKDTGHPHRIGDQPPNRRGGVRAVLSALWRDEGGAVAIMTALSLLMLLGFAGLSIDVGQWLRTQLAMQHAADSAVIAAVINGSINGSATTYEAEAKAVAVKYGFVDDANGIDVNAQDKQICPNGPSKGLPLCYKVTITNTTPIQLFTRVLHITGGPLNVVAWAGPRQIREYCMLALGSSGTSPAIDARGAPNANMQGCNIMSNTDANCTGHDLDATYGDAHGMNNGCGSTSRSYVPAVPDTYAGLASNIPSGSSCGGNYPQKPSDKKDPALPASNLWSGSKTLGATAIVCGDLQLTGNTSITSALPGSVLVIENGDLDLNGYTLSTADGSALTIIFSGTAGAYTHAPTGDGTLDIKAPTSGPWHGIAIYQDPALTTGVDISGAGNSPTWKITGVVYLPHASVEFQGAVNKSSYGESCFALVADNITIKGTASMLNNSGCIPAGVTPPSSSVAGNSSTLLVM